MQTQAYIPHPSGASLIILEDKQIRVCPLDTQPQWKIGRYDPTASNAPDILFTSRIVSREHGWIECIDDQWFFVDNPKNLNGTFHNGIKVPRSKRGIRVPILLESGDVLRIDNKDLDYVSAQGVLMFFTTTPVTGTWTSYLLKQPATFIGRDEPCHIVEPLSYMSARHAKITHLNGSYYLSDCGSQAGTLLNGQQVTSSTPLREKDTISICDRTFFFLGDRLLYAKHTEHQS